MEKHKKRIIIIDDNELSLRSLQKSFELNGLIVDAESDQYIAIEKHFEQNYDIILSDIMMPKMDGIQLTKLVKSKTPNTKVYLFTGFYTKEKQIEGLENGAEEVFPKPLPIIEVLEKFKNN